MVTRGDLFRQEGISANLLTCVHRSIDQFSINNIAVTVAALRSIGLRRFVVIDWVCCCVERRASSRHVLRWWSGGVAGLRVWIALAPIGRRVQRRDAAHLLRGPECALHIRAPVKPPGRGKGAYPERPPDRERLGPRRGLQCQRALASRGSCTKTGAHCVPPCSIARHFSNLNFGCEPTDSAMNTRKAHVVPCVLTLYLILLAVVCVAHHEAMILFMTLTKRLLNAACRPSLGMRSTCTLCATWQRR